MDIQRQTFQDFEAQVVYCSIAVRIYDNESGTYVDQHVAVFSLASRDAKFTDLRKEIQDDMDSERFPPRKWKFYLTPLRPVSNRQEGLFGSIASYLQQEFGDDLGDGTVDKPFRLALGFDFPKSPQVQAPPAEASAEEKVPAQSTAPTSRAFFGDGSQDKPICFDVGLADVSHLDLEGDIKHYFLGKNRKREEVITDVEGVQKRHGITDKLKKVSGTHLCCPNCEFRLCLGRKDGESCTEAEMWLTDNCNFVHTCLGDVNNGSVAEDDSKLPAKKRKRGNGL